MRDTFEFPVMGTNYTGLESMLIEAESQLRNTPVDLIPEPDNSFDPYAIGVWLGTDKIGYVPNRGNSCTQCFSYVLVHDHSCSKCGALYETFTTDGKSGLAWRLINRKVFEQDVVAFISDVKIKNDKLQITVHGYISV